MEERTETNINTMRMDKSVFSVSNLGDESDEREFWKKQTPADRLRALELMRQIMYGYNPIADRLQRVLTVSEHP